ncbi:MAG: hypothetical protein Q7S81_03800 [bacterium]|nr:hypothetical protein [bacterium]
MKKSILWMLLIALILSYLDGIATYVWITNGWAYEVGPSNSLIHKLIGLNDWLVFHALLSTIIALIIFLGKYEKVVKCWLIIEILILCLHLVTLKLYVL